MTVARVFKVDVLHGVKYSLTARVRVNIKLTAAGSLVPVVDVRVSGSFTVQIYVVKAVPHGG